jgi:hypothetical protein
LLYTLQEIRVGNISIVQKRQHARAAAVRNTVDRQEAETKFSVRLRFKKSSRERPREITGTIKYYYSLYKVTECALSPLFPLTDILSVSRDNSVGRAKGYRAGVPFPAGARDFSLLHSVQTGSEA